MTSAIVTERLTRRFGTTAAVDGIDLAVGEGRIFGLVGPNGAGKTTLIRMLCGIQRPSAGRASVLGFDLPGHARQVQRRLGYMSQAFSLYGELSVEENLRFYGRVYGGVSSGREDEVCRAVGLAATDRRTLARELPTGIRQRAALAAAVLHEPALVFLDEPTSGVDPAGRRELWGLMRELADSGTTVVVSTHVMTEAARCDEVALMVRGRALAVGPPDTLVSHAALSIMVVDVEPWQQAYAALKAVWPDTTLRGRSMRVPIAREVTPETVGARLAGLDIAGMDAQPATFEDAFVWYVRRAGDQVLAG